MHLVPKTERNSLSFWTALGPVAFHPKKLYTGSSEKYKQELEANKGSRADIPVYAVIPALFVSLVNYAVLLL